MDPGRSRVYTHATLPELVFHMEPTCEPSLMGKNGGTLYYNRTFDGPKSRHLLKAVSEILRAPSDFATEVMAGRVTSSPAARDWFKESAPAVSATNTGVPSHPTSSRPCRIPSNSPPPPQTVTIASGLTARSVACVGCMEVGQRDGTAL
jgi:hypothetical protein